MDPRAKCHSEWSAIDKVRAMVEKKVDHFSVPNQVERLPAERI
jgi:hypothetical protein